jgi:hypothetical protein
MSVATTTPAAAAAPIPLPVSDYPNSFHEETWARYATVWNEALATHLDIGAQKEALSNIVYGYLRDDLMLREMQIAKGVHKLILAYAPQLFPGESTTRLKNMISDAGNDPLRQYLLSGQLIEESLGELVNRVGGLAACLELVNEQQPGPIALPLIRENGDVNISLVLNKKNAPTWIRRAEVRFHKTPPEGEVFMGISRLIKDLHGHTVLLAYAYVHPASDDLLGRESFEFPPIKCIPSNETSVALFTSALQMHLEGTVLDSAARHLFTDSKPAQRFFSRVDAYARAQMPIQCAPNCHCRLEPEAPAVPATTTAQPKKE